MTRLEAAQAAVYRFYNAAEHAYRMAQGAKYALDHIAGIHDAIADIDVAIDASVDYNARAARNACIEAVALACERRCQYKHRGAEDCGGVCGLGPVHENEPHDCLERP